MLQSKFRDGNEKYTETYKLTAPMLTMLGVYRLASHPGKEGDSKGSYLKNSGF